MSKGIKLKIRDSPQEFQNLFLYAVFCVQLNLFYTFILTVLTVYLFFHFILVIL